MTFNDLNLNTPLRNALGDLGIAEPTPIQAQSFSTIMAGKDVVGVAQTGTGKTYAFLLPLLRLWQYNKQPVPRILIVVPTRELVVQIVEEVEKLTAYMNFKVGGVYGGTNINTQKKILHGGLDLVVGTPGRLLDLGYFGALKFNLIKKLVIDEVDEMLNLGFRPQLKSLLDLLPVKKQSLLFSATMTEEVAELIETFFNRPTTIEIVPRGTPLEQIIQQGYNVPNFNTKANLLELLLQNDPEMDKVLVFAPSKKLADRLHERLEVTFPEQIGVIHSNKSQNYRLRSVKDFHDGLSRILIATDVIARGIDISEVSHVVNMNIPSIPENYMHRIGRTGRADKQGIAISFITEDEKEFQTAIETLMDTTIPITPLPEELEISEILLEEEKPVSLGDKNYLQQPRKSVSSGAAFHEKSAKNQKKNFGGISKRKYRAMQKQKRKKKRK